VARTSNAALSLDTPARLVYQRAVDQTLADSFLIYSLSVISSRAIPDVRDGLKPVQRRLLWSMYTRRLVPDRPHVKSAKVVGDCMGSLHPHGDQALYDALVRMGQPHQNQLALVDPHGNFGGPDTPPAHYRYTECRLSPAALELLGDTALGAVPMRPTFDGVTQEPEALAARFPNLLVNGAVGIAVGFTSLVLPHNPGEVLAAARALLADPQLPQSRLVRLLPGPDLPQGGRLRREGLAQLHATGRATLVQQARWRWENQDRGQQLVLDQLPYQVGAEKVLQDLRKAGVAELLREARDATDAEGPGLVLVPKNGVDPQRLVGQLLDNTCASQTWRVQQVALVGQQPKLLTPRAALEHWLQWRLECERQAVARALQDLQHQTRRARVIRDVTRAPQVLQQALAAPTLQEARQLLRGSLKLDEQGLGWALDLSVRQVLGAQRSAAQAEYSSLQAQVRELRRVLRDPEALAQRVDLDLQRLQQHLARPRATQLVD